MSFAGQFRAARVAAFCRASQWRLPSRRTRRFRSSDLPTQLLRFLPACSKRSRRRSIARTLAVLESNKLGFSLFLSDSAFNAGVASPRHSKTIDEISTHQLLRPDEGRGPACSEQCRGELVEGPLTTHHLSNRHKHGLETPVTPCVFNNSSRPNRHRFGGVRLHIFPFLAVIPLSFVHVRFNNFHPPCKSTRAPFHIDTARRPLFQFCGVFSHPIFSYVKGGN